MGLRVWRSRESASSAKSLMLVSSGTAWSTEVRRTRKLPCGFVDSLLGPKLITMSTPLSRIFLSNGEPSTSAGEAEAG